MRLSPVVFIVLGTVAALGSRALAANSVGFDILGGVGTSGVEMQGTLDIMAEGFKTPFEAALEYAHQHSTLEMESNTNQYTAGVSHGVDDHWEWKAQAVYWKDSLNAIHYAGPAAGCTYTWSQDNAEEMATLELNADLFFYGTEVETSSATRRVFDKQLGRFVKKIIPPGTANEKTTQFHPSAMFEKPLFNSAAVPYLTLGHYFYTQDPSTLESLAGRPRFAVSSHQLNNLIGGFFKNNGEFGIRFALPAKIETDVHLGAAQSATDNTWATTQGATLHRAFFTHLKATLDWSRAIQSGISTDLFAGGLSYTF